MPKAAETYVIVNDRGEYFGWVHVHVDEWDNVCARGVTWVADWTCAHVFLSRRSAERRMAALPWVLCRMAVV